MEGFSGTWRSVGWAKGLALCVVTVLIGACNPTPPKDKIRELIHEGIELIEEEDVPGVQALATEDFLGRPPPMDKDRLRGGFFMMFRKYSRFGVFELKHPYPDIEINDELTHASTLLPVLVVRHKAKHTIDKSVDEEHRKLEEPEWFRAIAGIPGDLYRVHLKFRKVNGDWKVTHATVIGGGRNS